MNFHYAKEILSSFGWMARIDGAHRDFLLRNARKLTFTAGETIDDAGQEATGLWGLAEGAMMLTVPRDDGEMVPFLTVGEGFWVGDLSTLAGRRGTVGMEARRDCTLLNVPARAVRQLAIDHPESHVSFYQLNYQNLQLTVRLMAAQTAESANAKIALRLAILEDFGTGDDGWLSLTNQDLASQMGLSLATVRRALKRLQQDGVVSTSYGRITIEDREALLQFR